MLAKPNNTSQLGFFATLADQLDQKHSLFLLANRIEWAVFDTAFSKHYSSTQGKPAKPIRLMVSLLILKQLRNLSDESMVEQWSENMYYQYFSGAQTFTPKRPCVATELVEFRKRIGPEGIELILKESIRINGKDADEDTLSGDTTVQEKNITYPTDDKLYKKIIVQCQSIAADEQVELRQSYSRTVKKLSIVQRMRRNKGGESKARKASKKVKTIAGRLVRELCRKLPPNALNKHQKRSDTNKFIVCANPRSNATRKARNIRNLNLVVKPRF